MHTVSRRLKPRIVSKEFDENKPLTDVKCPMQVRSQPVSAFSFHSGTFTCEQCYVYRRLNMNLNEVLHLEVRGTFCETRSNIWVWSWKCFLPAQCYTWKAFSLDNRNQSRFFLVQETISQCVRIVPFRRKRSLFSDARVWILKWFHTRCTKGHDARKISVL